MYAKHFSQILNIFSEKMQLSLIHTIPYSNRILLYMFLGAVNLPAFLWFYSTPTTTKLLAEKRKLNESACVLTPSPWENGKSKLIHEPSLHKEGHACKYYDWYFDEFGMYYITNKRTDKQKSFIYILHVYVRV